MTINIDEGPALGVALLAGVGTGIYSSVSEACRATIQVASSTEVCSASHAVYDRYHRIYQALYTSLKANFASVAEIVRG